MKRKALKYGMARRYTQLAGNFIGVAYIQFWARYPSIVISNEIADFIARVIILFILTVLFLLLALKNCNDIKRLRAIKNFQQIHNLLHDEEKK